MKKIAEIIAAKNNKNPEEEMSAVLRLMVPIMSDSLVTNKNQVHVLATSFDKMNASLVSIAARSGIKPPPINVLSNSARYVIWWLTQIETDVYDTQCVSLKSYKDKVLKRRENQEPTKNCQCILKKYLGLLSDFNDLLPDERSISNLAIKEGTELRNYLDKVGQQILILKQKVAIQVKDNDETEKCIASQESQVMPPTKRS